MAYDVYCAVCGGPTFSTRISRFSRKALLRQKAEAGSPIAEDVFAGMEDWQIQCYQGYDPEICRPVDVAWTGAVQLLGFNPEATAIEKTFISGWARENGFGCMRVIQRSEDPNFPDHSLEFQCYRVFDTTKDSCFPIHSDCLKLLSKALTGPEGSDVLEKETLYHIIADLSAWGTPVPKLDFGEPALQHKKRWIITPGEEILVRQPGQDHKFTILLRNTVSTDDFDLPTPAAFSPDIESRIRSDIFAKLPYDVMHQIMLLLPSQSVVALCNASYSIHTSFRSSNRSFWRAAIHSCMPWFWEIHILIRHGTVDDETTDYKGLFLWLEKNTEPRLGMEGPFLGVANRRRIWGVCEQYAPLYSSRVALNRRERLLGGEAEEIWENSKNLGLPVVAQPRPVAGLRTSTAQWVSNVIRDTHCGALLEAVWDEKHSLVGLAMTISGRQRQLFGKDEGPGWMTEKVGIEKGSWIKGLLLHMPDMFLTGKLETSIKGITVHITDRGDSKLLGDTNPEYCQRFLSVRDQHVLIGIVGHISNENKICRLGLVQHPYADITQSFQSYTLTDNTIPGSSERPPLLHQPLWKSPNSSTINILHRMNAPIWSNNPRTLVALPSTERARDPHQIHAAWHDDLVPVDPLVWAANETERRSLQRLTAYLFEGLHICCLRAEYTVQSGIAPREIGHEAVKRMLALDRERPRAEAPLWWREWAAGMTVETLDVDGPGGESVVGVEVLHHEGIRTVSLRTNKRYVHWGHQDRSFGILDGTEAQRGYVIVGLALGFSFSGEVKHRWKDGSGILLRDNARMSWLATLTVDRAWFA